ncbi:MAG: hypothetical protein LC800_21865 [Acidobacteria bacterium]|nr:hypothetical protein [Acidobacteriota bacterium]
MTQGKLTLAIAAAAALVLTGAAFAAAAPAQSRKKTPPRRAAATPAPAPAPAPVAKQNARPADGAAARQPPQPEPSAETPAKRNAREGGETPVSDPAAGAARNIAAEVRYSFEFSQPEFVVRHYLIEHDAAGRGKITFERKNEDAAITEPFALTPAAYARIVSAWEALKFLDSEASYQADKQFPHLGTMRLRMKSGGRERTAEFNWTHNDYVSALTREYRALAEQQFFVFDISLARQYQPSEAIKILKRLESLIGSKQISDAGQLVELLRDLVTDERIPLIARNHAERLLKKIEK